MTSASFGTPLYNITQPNTIDIYRVIEKFFKFRVDSCVMWCYCVFMDNTAQPRKTQTSTFSIRLTNDQLKEVERIATEKRWSRNQTIVWLMGIGQKFHEGGLKR